MDSFRSLFNEKEEEPSLLEQFGESTTLSWKTRLYGFGICAGIGTVFWILASLLLLLSLSLFAVFYTLGLLCIIGATGFIVGPWRQIKSMVDPTRIITTVIFFLFMGLTLFAALYLKVPPLVFVFMLIQIAALIWYVLSYIPFARDCIKNAICGAASAI